jgi:hypothetical protein
VTILLTEQEISRSWRALFRQGPFTEETFAKADSLLDELRGESPLRHRLEGELTELRRMHKKKSPKAGSGPARE